MEENPIDARISSSSLQRFLPWYQPASTCHSYHMGNPFVHGYSMGYTFEGLTGRTSTNKIGERMHEACFRRVQVLPKEDDIFHLDHSAQEMHPEPCPSMEKGVEVDKGFSPLFYLGSQVGYAPRDDSH